MSGEYFEVMMLLSFGSAWPFAIVRTWTSRSSEGKSAIFLIIILVGYLFGLFSQIVSGFTPVIYFYALNTTMVATDLSLVLYLRRSTPLILALHSGACHPGEVGSGERRAGL
jgi:hypothetical protein